MYELYCKLLDHVYNKLFLKIFIKYQDKFKINFHKCSPVLDTEVFLNLQWNTKYLKQLKKLLELKYTLIMGDYRNKLQENTETIKKGWLNKKLKISS